MDCSPSPHTAELADAFRALIKEDLPPLERLRNRLSRRDFPLPTDNKP